MGFPKSAGGIPLSAPPGWTLGQSRFLRTDDGTALMNINGLPGGTPLIVWNGTGAGDTGGDWTLGGDNDGESTDAAHSGTNGLDTGERTNGDATTFVTGTAFDIQAAYDSISLWINPQRKDSGTTVRLRWFNGGTNVGTLVILDNYVPNWDLDVWQKITVPLSDFALPGSQLVDQLQIQYQSNGPKYERFYVDDIEINPAGAGGGPYIFQVDAPANTKQHVSMIVLLLSGASGGWTSTSFANVSALVNGLTLRHRRLSTSEVLWAITSKDNTDLFGRFHPQDDVTFNDSTLLIGFMIKPGLASVVITDDDVLEIVVQDDLSGLASARAFVHYGVEEVESA